jgi:hypothetical protein
MKILISSDGVHAHYFQRLSWLNAFRYCGIDAAIWDCKNVTAFDAFDSFEPDIFLGQSYNLTDSLLKCIYERPHLKVALRAGDWGDHEKEVDKSRYNILYCSNTEKAILSKLKNETGKPDFVHIHYDAEKVKFTHNFFSEIGIEARSLMMCADTFVYGGGKYDKKLDCDIGFVGGYWPYKGQVINDYLFPLLNNVGEYSVKIFGNQPWPVNQYCGLISDDDVKNLFVSSRISPNLSEPHAQKYGIDVNERIFKILYSGGFCVSDNVDSYSLFGNGVVLSDNPEDFKEKILFYLKEENQEKRQIISDIGKNTVKQSHTGFDRASQILKYFGLEALAKDILDKKEIALHD